MHTKNINRLSCPTMLKRLSVYCCALGLKELNDLDLIFKRSFHILQINFFLTMIEQKETKKLILKSFFIDFHHSFFWKYKGAT